MAEAIVRCMGCSGPIENVSSPGVIRATKAVKPPTLAGKLKAAGEEDAAYFHAGCFSGQLGYERA